MVNFQFQKHLVTINVQCHACKFLSAYNSRVNWFIPGLSAIAHSSTNKVSIVSQNIVCHTALSIDTCCCLRNDVLQASQHLTRFWVALHSSIHQKTLFNQRRLQNTTLELPLLRIWLVPISLRQRIFFLSSSIHCSSNTENGNWSNQSTAAESVCHTATQRPSVCCTPSPVLLCALKHTAAIGVAVADANSV